jgi:uncharacterized membrane protein
MVDLTEDRESGGGLEDRRPLVTLARRIGGIVVPPPGDGRPSRDPVWVRHLRRPTAGPVTALIAAMGIYAGVFGSLTWSQQSNFGTFGFDMGIYDQGIWLVSRFKTPFLTIRGLNYFAHHVNLITLLIVPLYWLGAGPHALYLIETIAIALGAVPLWLLGRDRFGNGWLALGPAVAYLLYPSLEWINEWHFHPDALIITPLMYSYWLATRRKWGWYWVAVVVTLSCKEDAALAVLVLGLVVWLKQRRTLQGLVTSAAGLAWFVICTKVIIPFANGGHAPFYTELFPGLGTSVTSIIFNIVRHPSRWLKPALSHSRWTYYAQLFWPVALLAFLEIPILLIAGPQLLVNVVSGHGYTHDIHYHYSSIVVAGVFLATVEGCARRGRSDAGRRFLVGLLVAASLAANVAWSPSPLGVKFHSGIWAKPEPKHRVINEAMKLIPGSDSVSATYYIDTHLTHRVLIYEFPNPWIPSNWGEGDQNPPDPAKVNWLILDTSLNGSMAPLYAKLIQTEFSVVFDRQGIVVAHRIVPGVPNQHDWPRS